MNAIGEAMGYYERVLGKGWWAVWCRDMERAVVEGCALVDAQAVLIGWPTVGGDTLYVHLACGRLEWLGELVGSGKLVLPWRWLLWQRGLRSQRWRLERTERVLARLGVGGCGV